MADWLSRATVVGSDPQEAPKTDAQPNWLSRATVVDTVPPEPAVAAPPAQPEPGFLGRRANDVARGWNSIQSAADLGAAVQYQSDITALQREPRGFLGRFASSLNPFQSPTEFAADYLPNEQKQEEIERLSNLRNMSVANSMDNAQEAAAIPRSADNEIMMGAFADGEYTQGFRHLLRHPVEGITSVIAESVPGSVMSMTPGIGGAKMAASIAQGPLRNIAAAAGLKIGMGAGSFSVDDMATLSEGLSSVGVDVNNQTAVVQALQNPEILSKAKQYAMLHGISVAAFDMLGAHLATKTFGGNATSAIGREVNNAVRQTGIQMATGAGGEATGQMASAGEFQPDQIIAEAIGEMLPTDLASAVITGAREDASAKPTPAPQAAAMGKTELPPASSASQGPGVMAVIPTEPAPLDTTATLNEGRDNLKGLLEDTRSVEEIRAADQAAQATIDAAISQQQDQISARNEADAAIRDATAPQPGQIARFSFDTGLSVEGPVNRIFIAEDAPGGPQTAYEIVDNNTGEVYIAYGNEGRFEAPILTTSADALTSGQELANPQGMEPQADQPMAAPMAEPAEAPTVADQPAPLETPATPETPQVERPPERTFQQKGIDYKNSVNAIKNGQEITPEIIHGLDRTFEKSEHITPIQLAKLYKDLGLTEDQYVAARNRLQLQTVGNRTRVYSTADAIAEANAELANAERSAAEAARKQRDEKEAKDREELSKLAATLRDKTDEELSKMAAGKNRRNSDAAKSEIERRNTVPVYNDQTAPEISDNLQSLMEQYNDDTEQVRDAIRQAIEQNANGGATVWQPVLDELDRLEKKMLTPPDDEQNVSQVEQPNQSETKEEVPLTDTNVAQPQEPIDEPVTVTPAEPEPTTGPAIPEEPKAERRNSVDDYFNARDLDAARNVNSKSREVLIYISPDDFLSMARKGQSDQKSDRVDMVIENGEKFGSIPTLSFTHNGNREAQVVDHDGRHRARALKSLGFDKIPVVIKSIPSDNGLAIRFGEIGTGSPDDISSEQQLPVSLRGQASGNGEDGNDNNVIPFPYKFKTLRKSKMDNAGEELGGNRRKGRSRTEEIDRNSEGKKLVDHLIEKTSRAFLWPIDLPEGASSGTKAYLEKVRAYITPFTEWAGRERRGVSPQAAKGKSWLIPYKEALIQAAEEPDGRNRLIQSAESYITTIEAIDEATSKSKTTNEAMQAMARLIFDEEAEFTEIGKKFASITHIVGYWTSSEKTRVRRFLENLFSSVTDDSKTADERRAKPMVRPRVEGITRDGMPDHRNGKDVTADDLVNTFGFRGVEFGEWVNADERQANVNQAYDAFYDLATTLGIPAKGISFGGQLGMAFGSRGGGEHAAHYEPTNKVINLTKTKGDGSVAHEWGHALDYIVGEDKKAAHIIEQIKNGLRQTISIEAAEANLNRLLTGKSFIVGRKKIGPMASARAYIDGRYWTRWAANDTQFAKDADELGKSYWGSPVELWARSFERFVFDKMPGNSPYLVNNWVEAGAVSPATGYKGTPYPNHDEGSRFGTMHDSFLKLLTWSDDGKPSLVSNPDFSFATADYSAVSKRMSEIGADLVGHLKKLKGKEGEDVQERIPAGDERESPETATDAEIERLFRGTPAGEGEGGRIDRSNDGPANSREERKERADLGGQSSGTGDSVRGDDTVSPGDEPVATTAEIRGENYVIQPGALDEARSWKQKASDNLMAIKLVKEIEADGRAATEEEQAKLAKYVGWGGIANIFPDPITGEIRDEWKARGEELKNILTKAEYDTARRSTQYAHYTSETIVRSMWSAMERLGFKGGQIFEPGMGVGNFPGMMPAGMAHNSNYMGIEYDFMTARIARLIYPKYGIKREDFTSTKLPDNTFDAVIGNPPFGDITITSDEKYPQKFFLHDYFFAKSIDMVRPGGVLAFVTSAGTMNKIDTTAREYLYDRADLLGAIRLPNNAFKKNAGTEVTTDIIFLRKRISGESRADGTWLNTTEITLKNDKGEDQTVRINEYFAKNPQMVLGENSLEGSLHGPNQYAVVAPKGFDLQSALEEAISRLPEAAFVPNDQSVKAEQDLMPPDTRDGVFYIKNGQLYQVNDGAGTPVKARGKEGGTFTKDDIEKIRAIIPLRDAMNATFSAMLGNIEENVTKAQARMMKAYEAFTSKFGPLNKQEITQRRPSPAALEEARNEERELAIEAGLDFDEGEANLLWMLKETKDDGKRYTPTDIANERQRLREEAQKAGREFNEGDFDPDSVEDVITIKYPNLQAFSEDPDNYKLRSIEDYNPENEEFKPGRIFFENIIEKTKPAEIHSASDALNVVLAEIGRVDIDLIASKYGKSKSIVLDELGDAVYRLPNSEVYVTADEYLSGNVKVKLADAKRWAEKDETLIANVRALEAVQPEDVPPSKISARLGAPWLTTEAIEQFGEHLGMPIIVTHYGTVGSWKVEGDKNTAAARSRWGTDKISGIEMISHALNGSSPTVWETIWIDGKESRQVDKVATEAAVEKFRAVKEEFENWVWTDGERASKLARIYNDEYNNSVARKFDGKHLTMPGKVAGFEFREHQKRVIYRIIQTGNTYMAHAVGAGKTSAMIAAGMEMRRLGIAKKPMYAVPNHMLAQFTKEFYELYPNARLMVADDRRFHTSRRKRFMAQVATSNIDAVIITHSSFKKIPLSEEFKENIIREEIEEYRNLLQTLDKNEDRQTVKRVEKSIQKLEERLKGKQKVQQDNTLTFEEMGTDFLFVDEAHEFRKLDFATKKGNVRGISPAGSKMAMDLYMKSRYLDTIRPQRNLVMASGTAITNTIAELYTVFRYLMRRRLIATGTTSFDAWAAVFADTVASMEKQPNGNYAKVERLARFTNVQQLSEQFREIADVVTTEDLSNYVARPAIEGGKMEIVLAPPSDEFREYQKELGDRMEAIKKRKGPPNPGDDIILTVINDGRHAAIDMRLINPDLPRNQDSKLTRMVDKVYNIWKDTADREYIHPVTKKRQPRKGATQIIFADLGIKNRTSESGNSFSAYKYIRNELIRRGVPEKEIAFMREYENHTEKQRLFNQVNEGEVRILVGSTKNMGTGVNAQRRIAAIHHLDAPWFPADLVQRNGRGHRQGNQNKTIGLYGYATEGSYDATMWDILSLKQSFIDQIMKGNIVDNEMADISSDADLYKLAAALATGDPDVLKFAELGEDLKRLRRQQNAHNDNQVFVRQQIAKAQKDIQRSQKRIQQIEEAKKVRQDISGDNFKVLVGGEVFTDREAAGTAILANVMLLKKSGHTGLKKVANIAGFDITVFMGSLGLDPIYEMVIADDFTKELTGTTARGLVASAESAARRLDADQSEYQKAIEGAERRLNDYKQSVDGKFAKQAELDRVQAEYDRLEAKLEGKGPDNAITAQNPDSDETVIVDEDSDNVDEPLRDIEAKVAKTGRGALKKIVPGVQDAAYEGNTEENPRVLTLLKRIRNRFEKGIISADQIATHIADVIHKMEDANFNKKIEGAFRDRARGYDYTMEKLHQARRRGDLSQELVDFTMWALKKNPALADNVSISIRKRPGNMEGSAGAYFPQERIVNIFKETENTDTGVHEILHHAERMMPTAIQDAIRKEWANALRGEIQAAKKANDISRLDNLLTVMEAANGNIKAQEQVIELFNKGKLTRDRDYQLTNPSEYWAVNATRLMQSKYEADSWIAKAKQWLKEMIETIKKILGLKNTSAIVNGLNGVLSSDGSFKSNEMLSKDSRVSLDIEDNKQDIPPDFEDFLKDVPGAKRKISKDMGLISKLLAHPRMVASMKRPFVPVYNASMRQQNERDSVISELTNILEPWSDLSEETKAKVGKLLEESRLEGRVKSLSDLRAAGLDEKEILGYRAVREAMDRALDMFILQFVDDMGYSEFQVRSSSDLVNIAKMQDDKEVQERMLNDAKKIAEIEQAKRRGYVPFTRFGNIVVNIYGSGEDKPLLNSTRVELGNLTKLRNWISSGRNLGDLPEVKETVAALLKQYPGASPENVEIFEVGKPAQLEGQVKLSDIDMLAQVADLRPEAWDEVRQGLQTAIKGRGFRSHFFGSRNTPGYSDDWSRVVADYVAGIGGYLARRRTATEWENAIKGVPNTIPRLRNYAIKYKEYLDNPADELVALRQTGFLYYLAGVPATALVNLTQVPMVTFPYMTMFTSAAEAGKMIGKSYVDVAKMFDAKRGTDVFNPDNAPEDVKEAMQEAWDQGFFVPLSTLETLGLANSRSAHLRTASKRWRKIIDLVAIKFTAAERTNRIVTFITAYRYAKQEGSIETIRKVLKGNALARSKTMLNESDNEQFARKFAEWVIEETQFRMGKINRPTLMRGVGTSVFQFKGFVMQQTELMLRMMSMHGKQGRKALIYMLALSVVAGGAEGLPFADDIFDALDAMYKKMTGIGVDLRTDLRLWVEEMTGNKDIAEMVMKGTSRQTGADFGQRITPGNIIPDKTSDLPGLWFDLIFGRTSRAIDAIKRGDALGAATETLPNFMKNIIEGVRMGETGYRSRTTGQVSIPPEKIRLSDQILKSMGFTSSYIARSNDAAFAIYNAEQLMTEVRSNYYGQMGRALARVIRASRSGDTAAADAGRAEIARINREIADYNKDASPEQIIKLQNDTIKKRAIRELEGFEAKKPARGVRELTDEIQRVLGPEAREAE